MSEINIRGYLDMTNTPWGRLFYRLAWHNIECSGKRILDFGSGFGITADHFAADNEVVAVEPNEAMLLHRFAQNEYVQITGGIEALAELEPQSFDMIICHNVLEYALERKEIFSEFGRLLRPDGVISVIKHNRAGKVMQKAVFENNTEEALNLLSDGESSSVSFGAVHDYSNSDIDKFCGGEFVIAKAYGLRMFFALQRNEFKTQDDWSDRLFALECAAQEVPEFRDIAFFHHLILKRT